MFNKSVQQILLSILMSFALLMSAPLSADPPEQSGPNVYRWEGYSWYWFSANSLIAFVGIDVPTFCDSGTFNVDQWDFHSVGSPSDIDLWIDQMKLDDAMTFVYPASFALEDGELDPFKLCFHVFEYGDLASGTTDAILNDNDVFAWRNDHKRANSFSLKSHGVLYTPSGEPVNFSGGFHCVFNYNPIKDEFKSKCKDRLTMGD
jgi:hypothetical protein